MAGIFLFSETHRGARYSKARVDGYFHNFLCYYFYRCSLFRLVFVIAVNCYNTIIHLDLSLGIRYKYLKKNNLKEGHLTITFPCNRFNGSWSSCSEEKSQMVPNPNPKQYWNNLHNGKSLFSATNQETPTSSSYTTGFSWGELRLCPHFLFLSLSTKERRPNIVP